MACYLNSPVFDGEREFVVQMPMRQPGPSEEFVRELTGSQRSLYAFALSLLPDPDRAADVLQDANVVMWRKATDFRDGTNFMAWACRVVRLEVLAHRRKASTDRHIFSEALLEKLAVGAEHISAQLDDQMAALNHCLDKLPERLRDLVADRYEAGTSVKSLADELGRSPESLAVTLHRARQTLLECITRQLAKEEHRE